MQLASHPRESSVRRRTYRRAHFTKPPPVLPPPSSPCSGVEGHWFAAPPPPHSDTEYQSEWIPCEANDIVTDDGDPIELIEYDSEGTSSCDTSSSDDTDSNVDNDDA